jgi:hypothetical protein
VILAGGKAVLDAGLAEALAAAHVELEVEDEPARLHAIVGEAHAALGLALPELHAIDVAAGHARVRIELPAGAIAEPELRAALGAACLRAGVVVHALVPGRTRLEERFAAVTGGRGAPT